MWYYKDASVYDIPITARGNVFIFGIYISSYQSGLEECIATYQSQSIKNNTFQLPSLSVLQYNSCICNIFQQIYILCRNT